MPQGSRKGKGHSSHLRNKKQVIRDDATAMSRVKWQTAIGNPANLVPDNAVKTPYSKLQQHLVPKCITSDVVARPTDCFLYLHRWGSDSTMCSLACPTLYNHCEA